MRRSPFILATALCTTLPVPLAAVASELDLGRTPIGSTRTPQWDFGCAEDYYRPGARVARQIELRMPIPAEQLLGVLPEPLVIHADLDASQSGGLQQCSTFAAGHLCYNGHEGTDFSLGGSFYQMGTVDAVAAASGVVFDVRENEFDRCQVNPDPLALLDEDPENNIVCADPDHPESVDVTRANKVSVCHADGTVTEYYHLMRDSVPAAVTNGAAVSCGQKVGVVGSSGKSSGPHLHLNVLVPVARAQLVGSSTGRIIEIGGRDYVHIDPHSVTASRSMWTSQTWNYAVNFANGLPVPALQHPAGHPTTLACPHLVPPHSGHPGPNVPCTHPSHGPGDPVMVPCTHPLHPPHYGVACTHPKHPDGHQLEIAGVKQYSACTHPQHPMGDPTTLPCTHAPVPQHPNGHPGPTTPCTHVVFTNQSISALALPGPQCDL